MNKIITLVIFFLLFLLSSCGPSNTETSIHLETTEQANDKRVGEAVFGFFTVPEHMIKNTTNTDMSLQYALPDQSLLLTIMVYEKEEGLSIDTLINDFKDAGHQNGATGMRQDTGVIDGKQALILTQEYPLVGNTLMIYLLEENQYFKYIAFQFKKANLATVTEMINSYRLHQ